MIVKALITMALVSFCIRFSPFLLSSKWTKARIFKKLGATLSPCLLILLTTHQLQDISLLEAPYGLPEMGGLSAVILSQWKMKNIVLSMCLGVACYQLIQYFLG